MNTKKKRVCDGCGKMKACPKYAVNPAIIWWCESCSVERVAKADADND